MTPQRIAFIVVLLLWIGILAALAIGLHVDFYLLVVIGLVGWLIIARLFQPPRPTLRQRTTPPPAYPVVAAKIDAIEAEMKRIGYWQETPLAPEQYQFRAAFAADTMAFPQWLQFVFIPNVRAIITQRGAFPAVSQVGSYAVREFDSHGGEADQLARLLWEFDQLF